MRVAMLGCLIVASMPTLARADARTEVGKLVDTELVWIQSTAGTYSHDDASSVHDDDVFIDHATILFSGHLDDSGAITAMVWGPSGAVTDQATIDHRRIAIARDGKSAWLSFDLHATIGTAGSGGDEEVLEQRVTELAVSTAHGWRIAGGEWSSARPNARVNKDAKAGKLDAFDPLSGDAGDRSLRKAFDQLATGPVDADAAASKDLVAIGSGPGELTVGGAGFAKAWAAAWANHVTIDSELAMLAPSGTTGWVLADVRLAKGAGKGAYTIPFQVCFVFDKTAAGAWSLVQAHFAAP